MVLASRLLCFLDRHAAGSEQLWNHGVGFARCRHCHQMLVRSLTGRWQRPPPRTRVVWQAEPPERAINTPFDLPPAPVARRPLSGDTEPTQTQDSPAVATRSNPIIIPDRVSTTLEFDDRYKLTAPDDPSSTIASVPAAPPAPPHRSVPTIPNPSGAAPGDFMEQVDAGFGWSASRPSEIVTVSPAIRDFMREEPD